MLDRKRTTDAFRVFRIAPLAIVFIVSAILGVEAVQAQRKPDKPDINKPFRNPDVGKFVERFEHEGREIYDKRDATIKACEIKEGMSVADIGAGTGLYTRLFAAAVGPKGRVYAVDIAKKFIDHVIKSCRAQNLDNVVGVVCKTDSAELPANSIDVAFLCDTYHHFEYPKKTMESIRKALRPGGKLYVIDFKRIKGTSPKWIMGHVRAGKEVVRGEIEDGGFVFTGEEDLFKQNYFLKFRKKEVK